MNKVVIVGCGNVGMAYAYSLVISGSFVDELVLIDINKEKAEGEVQDLNHALSYAPKNMIIKSGNYSDCKNANIVCLCAGKNQLPGETRTDLITKNFDVFKSVIKEVKKNGFKGIYLVATNPLDAMTYATLKLSGAKTNKVFGSGTTLDTARLKYLISKEIKVNAKDINAYVLGEHGDSELVAWSTANIFGNSIDKFLNENQKAKISYDVRTSAYDIINKKGSTSYGIGMCLLKITNSILNNERDILTISHYNKQFDLYFASPAIIGKNGVEQKVEINLNEADSSKLCTSIETLQDSKNVIDKLLKNI